MLGSQYYELYTQIYNRLKTLPGNPYIGQTTGGLRCS